MIVSHLTRNVWLFAVLIAIIMIVPVSASVQVTGTVKYMETVAPGSKVTFPITLTTGSTDKAADYNITVFGFGNDGSGSYTTVPPELDIDKSSARPYVTVDQSVVHIEPGASKTVTATVTVPQSATGGLYALINIKQAGQTGMVRTAINVPVMITVKGTDIKETGTVDTVNFTPGLINPSSVTTTFTNTGNHHYYGIKNTVLVYDEDDKTELSRSNTQPLVTAIVPGGTVTFTQQLPKTLPPGIYPVHSYIEKSDGTLLAMNTNMFTVTDSAQPGNVTATPTQESPGFGAVLAFAGIVGVAFVISRRQ